MADDSKRRFGVWAPLSMAAREELFKLARKERRGPREQAAVLLEAEIARFGKDAATGNADVHRPQ